MTVTELFEKRWGHLVGSHLDHPAYRFAGLCHLLQETTADSRRPALCRGAPPETSRQHQRDTPAHAAFFLFGVATAGVMFGGERRYRFYTRPYVAVEAAQAAVAAFRFQQWCPYSPLA